MKSKSILFISLTVLFLSAQAQKNIPGTTECKLVHDKKTDREYFKNTDTNAEEPVGFSSRDFIRANFRIPDKKYGPKDRIYFAYIIEKDGAVSFLKLLALTSDKEIEDEAKRVVSLMPKWLAARCAKEYVASMADISFQIDWLKKNQ